MSHFSGLAIELSTVIVLKLKISSHYRMILQNLDAVFIEKIASERLGGP